jgi:hypothetical protein
MSGETGNLILSVLSDGPVGTGDRIGKEDKSNILMAARPDGVLVKPDRPARPCDQSYLDRKAPVLASTFTSHGDLRTLYLFGSPRFEKNTNLQFSLADLGATGKYYLLDRLTGLGRLVDASETVDYPIGESGFKFLEAAPVSKSGIVLLGDLGKFVATGKHRVASVTDALRGLTFRVSFAAGEGPVVLTAICPTMPILHAALGTCKVIGFDQGSGWFTFAVGSAPGRSSAVITLANANL